MTAEKVYKLETEVAVINSKLDDISRSLKRLTEWTARHEVEHKRIMDEHEDIRAELRSSNTVVNNRVGLLEREFTAFSSRQNVINTILGFVAGAIVTVLVTVVFGG